MATAPSTLGTQDTIATNGLHVRGLCKEYPTPAEPLVVLRDVSLDLSPGQSLAIVGPSGSGKSTLLNILGTLDAPTSGVVAIDGADPFALAPAKLAHFRSGTIGFVFQDHHLLPQLNATENVLVARLAARRVKSDDLDRARDLLAQVGLSDRATHLPAELSGGERQRVAIARALMNGPLLLLADEPTGNLDSVSSKIIADLLFDLASRSHAILVAVTHSQELAGRFGRKMRMADGTLGRE